MARPQLARGVQTLGDEESVFTLDKSSDSLVVHVQLALVPLHHAVDFCGCVLDDLAQPFI